MRPVLPPTLRRFWRDDATLQLGRAGVLVGLSTGQQRVLDLLDGSLDTDQVLHEAGRRGCPADAAQEVLDVLVGLLVDADDLHAGLTGLDVERRRALAPEAAALVQLHGRAAGLALVARRAARVRLAGPLSDVLSDLLTRSGVGTVEQAGSYRTRPDLLVLTTDDDQTRALAETAVRADLPHLTVHVESGAGIVGPLVLPGRTACLHCLDLSRSDRDPGWPAIALQRRAPARDSGGDGVLEAAVVAQAARQVLQLLEGQHTPASAGGTLETVPPDWRWRRRSWPLHPDCPCARDAHLDEPRLSEPARLAG